MSTNNNGSMAIFSSEIKSKQELVHQFATLIQSMDKIETGFSTQQKLSHSQDFDDLRIKLVNLYIKRYQNEEKNVGDNIKRLEHETNNIEHTLSDYISNRNQLLFDIHRILQEYNNDIIDINKYQFIPKTYKDSLPQSIQQKYQNILHKLEHTQNELEKDQNMIKLLKKQLNERDNIISKGDNKIVHDLIIRAEFAENKVEQLSFINDKLQKQSLIQTPIKQNKNGDDDHQYELVEAQKKIKSLQEMLKYHQSELVATLTQKLKESENQCIKLKKETEEKLSFAKYLMTTKEQRLEAEKTINLTLQREIEEMKEQSTIYETPNYQPTKNEKFYRTDKYESIN